METMEEENTGIGTDRIGFSRNGADGFSRWRQHRCKDWWVKKGGNGRRKVP